MAMIIDGKQIAGEIKKSIADKVAAHTAQGRRSPGLAVVLVGENPASQVYVASKGRACRELGLKSFEYRLVEGVSQSELLELVNSLNARPDIDGILVQLPLPKHIDEKTVINAINPDKDVDGFHPVNAGRLVIGDPDAFLPCTPHGCQIMISKAVSDLKGKHVVIVGRSNIVGKPMANLMVQKGPMADCVVTICHSAAPDISVYTRQADILVAAAGVPGLITADMVKDGVVVIDVGMNRVEDPSTEKGYRLCGDVDFAGVEKKAAAITPVPGGVGQMTIAMLMYNTLLSYERSQGL